jgi:signal transduction histidine kinase/DNA-binding NarL/FixJ family response regulator
MSVARFDAEQTKLLYAQARSGIFGGLAVAVLVALYFWNTLPPVVLAVWLVPAVLINLCRWWLVHRFDRQIRTGEPTVAQTSSWRKRYIVTLTLVGLIAGLGTFMIEFHLSTSGQFFAVAILCAIVTVNLMTSVASLWALVSFQVSLLLPSVVFFLFFVKDPFGVLLAVVLVAMSVILGVTARRFNGILYRSLELRFANTELVGRLRQATLEAQGLAATANEANRAKSEFLANISHEIRTPMNAVVGTAHLLADTELSSEQDEYIGIIHQSADSLLTIINDILDHARIEAKKLVLESREIDIRSLLESILSTLSLRSDHKGLALTSHIAPEVPRLLHGDPNRLRQILVNLLGNAIKFTDAGSVTVGVGAEGESSGRVSLRFDIQDTGIGIAQDQMARLFDAFTQVDSSSTRRHGGTGLGLTISKQLVELMDGRIGVKSVVGEGSTFWFTLDLDKRAPQRQARTVDESPTAPTLGSIGDRRRQARVLVAEDDPTSQLVIVRTLEKLGLWVDAVTNGEEAIGALTAESYDLVLMDVQMPRMDGIEATITVRDLDSGVLNHHVPIIAMTAHAMKEHRQQCLAAGMNAFVSKPVQPDELLYTIERQLYGSTPPELRSVDTTTDEAPTDEAPTDEAPTDEAPTDEDLP